MPWQTLTRWLRGLRPVVVQRFGAQGEAAACGYLERLGWNVLEQSSRNRLGEIDIVALDGDTIVFVEVKTRKSAASGLPVEAVTFDKQRRLTRAALAYLKRKRWLERRARFDVLGLVWPDGAGAPEIMHYRNAFEPTGHGQMFS